MNYFVDKEEGDFNHPLLNLKNFQNFDIIYIEDKKGAFL